MRHHLRMAALLLALSVPTACGSETEPPTAGRSDGAGLAGLADRTFVSTQVSGHRLVPGSPVRLTFTTESVGAQAGCNSLSGAASVSGGVLVTDAVAMTEMACPEPRMAQDTWLAEFLGSAPQVTLDGDRLTLTTTGADATTLHLTDETAPTVPLEGTRWRLDAVLSGQGPDGVAISPPQGAGSAGLVVRDGQIEVDTGCNTAAGDVERDDSTLAVTNLALTDRTCPAPLADLQAVFVRVLQPPTSYSLDGDQMVLTSGDGGAGLSFRAG